MLRQIGAIVSSLFLLSCYGVSDNQTSIPIGQIVGSGSGSGSDTGSGSGTGSGTDACPVCSGSACCDEPVAHPPTETEESASSAMLDDPAAAASPNAVDDNGDTPLADDTNQCTRNYPELPEGCLVFRGNARWLYCWYLNGYETPFRCLIAAGAAPCELSNDLIAMIAATCNIQAASEDRIKCAIDAIRNGIGGGNGTNGNVCRHFSRCFKKVYEAMGFSQSVVSRLMAGLPPAGHAFNTVPTTTGTYYVDSSNDILFWCPN